MTTATATKSRWTQVDLAKDYMASVIREAERTAPVAGTPEMDALVAEYLDARATIEAAYRYAQGKTDERPFA